MLAFDRFESCFIHPVSAEIRNVTTGANDADPEFFYSWSSDALGVRDVIVGVYTLLDYAVFEADCAEYDMVEYVGEL